LQSWLTGSVREVDLGVEVGGGGKRVRHGGGIVGVWLGSSARKGKKDEGGGRDGVYCAKVAI